MPRFTLSLNEFTQKVRKLLKKYIKFQAVSENVTPPGKISATAGHDGRDEYQPSFIVIFLNTFPD